MPKKQPAFADVYGIAPALIGDAHRAHRRCAVVHSREDYVTVFGRTTKTKEFEASSCLLSDVEHSCRLDKPGMYSTRFQHSVVRANFNEEHKCEYYGTLAPESAEKLRKFWERLLGY
ncbi:hypothetical protein [Microbacterium sp. P04]|uniref:hypothetical protein n=1 Tax=Microbacterium sp. P04 TaxID=3366947 RepID=UPI003745F88E